MKHIKLLCLLAALSPVFSANAQSAAEQLLRDIEQNNTTLKALRDQAEAQALQNKTGITLPDPEVEFAYLWGSPSGVPGRTDFAVSQSFDMPTLLGSRRRVAEGENALLGLQYKQERIALLLEARLAIVDLIFANATRSELAERLRLAQELSDGYAERLKSGDANAVEANKAALNLSMAEGDLQSCEVERLALLQNLQRLNGGVAVDFEETTYVEAGAFGAGDCSVAGAGAGVTGGAGEGSVVGAGVCGSFEEWYSLAEERNPLLGYIRSEISLNRERVKLSKASGLPSFSVGYISELIPGDNHRGVSVGLSVPLWSNRNRVKQSAAAVRASESRLDDAKSQFYSSLAIQYDKTEGYRRVYENYRTALSRLNNASLLKKALDAGQISLLDYIVELGFYYDAVTRMLEAERDYHSSLACLQAVWL